MPTTPNRDLPYPPATGVAPAGHLQMQELAEAIDDLPLPLAMAAGTYAVAVGSGTQTIPVVFPVGRFTAVPVVIPGSPGVSTGVLIAAATEITTAGCNLRITHRDGSSWSNAYTGGWIAVQMGA